MKDAIKIIIDYYRKHSNIVLNRNSMPTTIISNTNLPRFDKSFGLSICNHTVTNPAEKDKISTVYSDLSKERTQSFKINIKPSITRAEEL
jgi:hypothetical protein